MTGKSYPETHLVRFKFPAEGFNRFKAVFCESLSRECMYKQTGRGFFFLVLGFLFFFFK